jgi:hypothetical protein
MKNAGGVFKMGNHAEASCDDVDSGPSERNHSRRKGSPAVNSPAQPRSARDGMVGVVALFPSGTGNGIAAPALDAGCGIRRYFSR